VSDPAFEPSVDKAPYLGLIRQSLIERGGIIRDKFKFTQSGRGIHKEIFPKVMVPSQDADGIAPAQFPVKCFGQYPLPFHEESARDIIIGIRAVVKTQIKSVAF